MGHIWGGYNFEYFLGCLKFLIFILGCTVDAGPEPTYEEQMRVPPPLGLKHLVPNYYFVFSCLPLVTLVRFPCEGGGAQQLQCKSESAQCSEIQQSPCDGLKLEKMLENNKVHT